MPDLIDQNEALEVFRNFVFVECKTQKVAAQRLDVSQTYVGDILKKKRDISENIALKIGYNLRKMYEKVENE